MADNYGSTNPYDNYGDKNQPSAYDLLMQMKAWNKEIFLTIENMDLEVRTALQVLDGEIKQNILDVKQGLETNISTTAQGLQASFSNTASGLQTQITANATGLASKVSSSDFNGTKVASLITQTPSAISAMANALNLSGYVTFSSLTAAGNTIIDGSRIQTGYISADRILASTVLAKLIAAGGIDAGQITSGTISTARLSANAITTTLLNAGGINASLITAGTITGVGINGYGINGTYLSASDGLSAPNIDIGSYYGMIQWPDGSRISKNGSGLQIYAPGGVSIPGFDSGGVGADTTGLRLGFSTTSKRLYIRIGSQEWFVSAT